MSQSPRNDSSPALPFFSRALLGSTALVALCAAGANRPVHAQAFALPPAKKTPVVAKPGNTRATKATPPKAGGTVKMPPPGGAPSSPLGVKLGSYQVAPPPGYQDFVQGTVAYRARKWTEAERLFRKAVAADPHFSEAWANLGLTLEYQKRTDEAIPALQKAIASARTEKATGPFWEELVHLYGSKARWSDMITAAQKALAYGGLHEPDVITASLGAALFNSRRYEEALPVLLKGKHLRGEPEMAPEIRVIYTLAQLNRMPDALEHAHRLAERYPKEATPQMLIADLEQRRGNRQAAGAAWTHAYALAPNDLRAGMNAAIDASIRSDRAGSERILRSLLQKHPDEARVHFQLGLLYYEDPANRKEQYPFAEREFTAAAVRDPKNPAYVTYIGLAAMMQGPPRYAAAEKYFQSALKLDPDQPTARMGVGYLAEQRKDNDTAIRQYQDIVKADRDPNYTFKAQRRLAGLLYTMNRKDEAFKEFEAIVVHYPDERGTTTLSEEASLLLSDGRLEQARNAYARLVTLTPKDPNAYIGLGQTLDRMKQPEEALKVFQNALTVDPKNDTAALLAGSQLKAQKKPAEAIAIYEKLLATAGPKEEHNQVRRQLASDYEEQGRIDDALAQLSRIVLRKDDPAQITLLLARPRVMAAHQRYDAALQELNLLAQEHPNEEEIRLTLAETQEKAGHPEAAEKTLTDLVNKQQGPRAAQQARTPRLLLAELYEREKKWDNAAPLFEEVLRTDPLDTRALPGLTRVREAQKRPEAVGAFLEDYALSNQQSEPVEANVQAVERYYRQNNTAEKYAAFTRRLVERYPHNRPSLKRRIAVLVPDALKNDADRAEAEKLVRHLIELDPQDSMAHVQLGTILEASGKTPEAIAAYSDAVRLSRDNVQALAALRRLGAPIPEPPKPPVKPTANPGGAAGNPAPTAQTNPSAPAAPSLKP